MLEKYPFLKDVYNYCKKWGVELEERTNNIDWYINQITHIGPGYASLNINTQTIVFYDCENPNEVIGDILHDLSHIICGEEPSKVSEVSSSMMALDLAHHKYIGNMEAYDYMMRGFVVDMFGKYTFQELTQGEQDSLYQASYLIAQEKNLLKDWKPTFIRC